MSASKIAIGARVRITAGQAKNIEGVVIAEYMPLKPKAYREWHIRTADHVRERWIRHDYLEVLT